MPLFKRFINLLDGRGIVIDPFIIALEDFFQVGPVLLHNLKPSSIFLVLKDINKSLVIHLVEIKILSINLYFLKQANIILRRRLIW